jgi:D-alanine-D-alanine ligase
MPNLPTIAILCGGVSPEHEVSLNSARNIYTAIDRKKYEAVVIGVARDGAWCHLPEAEFFKIKSLGACSGRRLVLSPGSPHVIKYETGDPVFPKIDVVFPIIHGPFGEDGTLQGLLSLLGLPFVGPGVLGSSAGMDKDVTKRLLRDAGILVAPWVTIFKHEQPDFPAIIEKLGFPVFVKPANMGSSVGISKAGNERELREAVALAFKFDTKVLVEKGIEGREIETAVLGNLENAKVSGVGEIVMERGFYDYESKYLSPDAAKVVIPARDISDRAVENVRATALKAYHVLGLEGLSRMDVFLVDDDTVCVNEPNTLPGFTNISMYPKLWAAAGIDYPDLIDRLIQLAIERHRREGALQRTRF